MLMGFLFLRNLFISFLFSFFLSFFLPSHLTPITPCAVLREVQISKHPIKSPHPGSARTKRSFISAASCNEPKVLTFVALWDRRSPHNFSLWVVFTHLVSFRRFFQDFNLILVSIFDFVLLASRHVFTTQWYCCPRTRILATNVDSCGFYSS